MILYLNSQFHINAQIVDHFDLGVYKIIAIDIFCCLYNCITTFIALIVYFYNYIATSTICQVLTHVIFNKGCIASYKIDNFIQQFKIIFCLTRK